MSSSNNNFLDFPDELVMSISDFLDYQTLSEVMPLLCRRGNSLFANSNFWEEKLYKDFDVDKELVKQIHARRIYIQLMILKNQCHRLPEDTQYFIQDKTNIPIIVACLTKNLEFFKTHVNEKYFHKQTVVLALFIGCSDIADHIFTTNFNRAKNKIPATRALVQDSRDFYLEMAIRTGNIATVKMILLTFSPPEDFCLLALKKGQLEIFELLNEKLSSDSKIEDDVTPLLEPLQRRTTIVSNILQSGSLNLFKKFVTEDDQYHHEYLDHAVKSGSVAMVKHVLEFWKIKATEINDEILVKAQGEVIEYLLDETNGYKFTIDIRLLSKTIEVKPEIFFKYISQIKLTKEDQFQLFKKALTVNNEQVYKYFLEQDPTLFEQISKYDLNEIIKIGNLEAVKLILKRNPSLSSTLDRASLVEAIHSSHFAMVEYLLDPHHQFNIQIDEGHFKLAAAADPLNATSLLLAATRRCNRIISLFEKSFLSELKKIESLFEMATSISPTVAQNTIHFLKIKYADDENKIKFLEKLSCMEVKPEKNNECGLVKRN